MKFLRFLSVLPALFMMFLIFQFSSQAADESSMVSSRAALFLIRSADYMFNLELSDEQVAHYIERLSGPIRKTAHVLEYFVLALTVSLPLYMYGVHGFWQALLTLLICFLYACSDEYHQTLISGRSGEIRDILIDSFGIVLGILFARIPALFHRLLSGPPQSSRNRTYDRSPSEHSYGRTGQSAPVKQDKRVKNQTPARKASASSDPAAPGTISIPSFVKADPVKHSEAARFSKAAGDARSAPSPGSSGMKPTVPPSDSDNDPGISGTSDELSEDMPFFRLLHPHD